MSRICLTTCVWRELRALACGTRVRRTTRGKHSEVGSADTTEAGTEEATEVSGASLTPGEDLLDRRVDTV